eukprot:TRINITY_DN14258_c0_g1_i3.p1 TRINITY_DN14258_c0_g1~~TRINITY_DN14258_c0_g1_i3.p1  ORF type:complete len:599 (-),score=131.10 TRINITY_DN14258_c0_g1_i3:74-1870(-)
MMFSRDLFRASTCIARSDATLLVIQAVAVRIFGSFNKLMQPLEVPVLCVDTTASPQSQPQSQSQPQPQSQPQAQSQPQSKTRNGSRTTTTSHQDQASVRRESQSQTLLKSRLPLSREVEPKVGVRLSLNSPFSQNQFKYENGLQIFYDSENISEWSKFVPLRFTERERNLLSILEGALEVSEYTDKVDVIHRGNKFGIIKKEIHETLSVISGLYVAHNFISGQGLTLSTSNKDKEAFFSEVFELGRRYKMVNPDKMRTNYGKLMFLLMDLPSALPTFSHKPIQSVNKLLTSRGCMSLLKDPNILTATACITSSVASDRAIQVEARKRSRENIIQKFSSKMSEEEIKLVLDSVTDSNTHLLTYRHPIDQMINYLTKYFHPNHPENGFSLAISHGKNGSKLTHSHGLQFNFVYQTLQLWREMEHNIFKLWYITDNDLLNCKNPYKLCNTGQGLHRVQSAPQVLSTIRGVLNGIKSRVGGRWVGLEVIHLGDRDVPNALVVIDKYCQVPRILTPIVSVLDNLDILDSDPALHFFVKSHGGLVSAKKKILCDFFQHGFDGSGDDGGSCIDGRLTSCWNWCSKIEKKPFYPLFLLSGFLGLDV